MSGPTLPALGLDLATRAGYAVRFSNKSKIRKGLELNLISGVAEMKVVTPSAATKNKPADHPGLRFNKYRQFLIELIETHGIKTIFYEEPAGSNKTGGNTLQVAVGFKVITLEVASIYDIPCRGFHIATVKKHATGSGKLNSDKQAMIDAALDRFPGQEWVSHKPTKRAPWTLDDNQADALHVLDCGLVAD